MTRQIPKAPREDFAATLKRMEDDLPNLTLLWRHEANALRIRFQELTSNGFTRDEALAILVSRK